MESIEHRRKVVLAGKIIVLVGWILIPLTLLLLQQFVPLIAGIALCYGLLKIGIEFVKYFGDPDRMIPGHKEKKEKESMHRHFIHHCERNPKGFARLMVENLKAENEKKD